MKPASWLGRQRTDLDACGSTNDEAARLARAGASHGAIVIAASQRAGRGRDGHVWVSPPGAGLYLSIVLRPPLPAHDVPPLVLALGIAVCDAARAHGAYAELKWPNDILVGRQKLGGVLVESESQGGRIQWIVVGIGVNLVGDLPPELHAISIERARDGDPVDRETFIAELLAQLEMWIDRYIALGLPAVAEPWRTRMAPDLVCRATIDGILLVGVCAGLADDGALVLREATGAMHRVRSGDVQIDRQVSQCPI